MSALHSKRPIDETIPTIHDDVNSTMLQHLLTLNYYLIHIYRVYSQPLDPKIKKSGSGYKK